MLALQAGHSVPNVDYGQVAALVALVLLWIGVWIWICRYLGGHLRALPKEATHLTPGTQWLLLVPFVGLFANFWILLGIAYGYRRAFEDLGRELPPRETGRTEALAWSIGAVVGFYPAPPVVLALIWMGALLALVVYLFKLHSLRERFLRIEKD